MLILDTLKKYRHPHQLPKVSLVLVIVSLLLNAYLFYSVWNVQYQNLQSQQARIDVESDRRAILQTYIADLRDCIDKQISPCPKSQVLGDSSQNEPANY